MATYNFNSLETSIEAKKAEVWVKPTWSSDWIPRPDLIPIQATWTHAPQIPTATLEYRYGAVMLPGTHRIKNYEAITARGYWVMIRWESDQETPMFWLGYAESPITVESSDGRDRSSPRLPAAGKQHIPCFGMESLLQESIINSVVHINPDSGATGADKVVRSGSGTTFNFDNKGNRTKEAIPVSDDMDAPERYLFDSVREDTREFWSTRDIIEYLMSFHLPTNDYGASVIPWGVDSSSIVPHWDQPSVDVDQLSVFDVLNQLLSAERMLGWLITGTVSGGGTIGYFESAPTVSAVNLTVFSRSAEPITLPSIGVLQGNVNQHYITEDLDPLTDTAVDIDDSDVYDQVIVQGPREVTVCTLRASKQISEGWDSTQKTKYEEGPEGSPVLRPRFLAMQPFEKQEANAVWRSLEPVEDVYELFNIKGDWDGTAIVDPNDPDSATTPVFTKNPDGTTHVPYLANVTLSEELPLFRGVDYRGSIDDVVEDKRHKQLKRGLLFFERGINTDVWARIDDAALMKTGFNARTAGVPLAMKIEADNEDGPAFRVLVDNGPRHAISRAFKGNSGDNVHQARVFGDISYANMQATVALLGDRRPAWAIPFSVPSDIVRRKIITLEHPALESVLITKGTALGVDIDGKLESSDGGVLRNPFPLLSSLATLAAANHLEPRKSVRIVTGRRTGGIWPGHMIRTVNGDDTKSVVREIRIEAQVTDGTETQGVKQTILATTNEVDAISLMGRIPEPDVLRHAARSNEIVLTANQVKAQNARLGGRAAGRAGARTHGGFHRRTRAMRSKRGMGGGMMGGGGMF